MTTTTQISIALLAATGMKPQATIENLANNHPFERIRACVAHWYMNRKCVGGEFKDTPGIVLYWLLNWETSAIPEIHPGFYSTQLYLDHRTKAERRAERRAARLSAQPSYRQPPAPASPPAPAKPACAHDEAWADLLTDLAITLPNADNLLIDNLTITQIEPAPAGGLHYHIAVAKPATMQRLQRLTELFERRLAATLKQKISVTFTLAELKTLAREPPMEQPA